MSPRSIISIGLATALLCCSCQPDTDTVAPVTPKEIKPQAKAGGKVQNGGVFDATPDPAPPGVQTGTK